MELFLLFYLLHKSSPSLPIVFHHLHCWPALLIVTHIHCHLKSTVGNYHLQCPSAPLIIASTNSSRLKSTICEPSSSPSTFTISDSLLKNSDMRLTTSYLRLTA